MLPRLGQGESYGAYFPPAISRDGRFIAFATRRGRLAVAKLDIRRGRTLGPARLLRGVTPPHAVAWSPHGTKLALTQGQSNGRLSIIGRDGRGLRKLRCSCPAVEADQGGFAWSRAGIAFGATPAGGEPRGIFVVQPDGRGLHRVTASAGGDDDNQPVWSPDASRLAFVRGGERVYVVAAGGGPVRLVARVGHAPAWAPSGRFIAYVAGRGESSLRVKDLATGARWQVLLPDRLANYGGISQLIWRS
jgi:Tol biopolymer transport system component